jgi:chromosome segregation ATPase
MCKKVLVAAVAVVVGLFIVKKTELGSLMHVWWKDARASLERQVPPEVQIKQLKHEIEQIDKDIQKNLGRLAKQEADYELLEKQVAALHARQEDYKTDIRAMVGKVKAAEGTASISYKGHKFRPADLTRKLESTVSLYETKKEQLKGMENLLQSKKRTLEVSRQRIDEIFNQKEELSTLVAKLETQVEVLKLKQTESAVQLDDSHLGRCKELVSRIERRLAVEEKELALQTEYGYNKKPHTFGAETKPAADVLKDAEKALQDDEAPAKVAIDKATK